MQFKVSLRVINCMEHIPSQYLVFGVYIMFFFLLFISVRKIELWLRFEGSNVSNQQVHNFNCVVHLFRWMVIICIRCTEYRVNRWSLYILYQYHSTFTISVVNAISFAFSLSVVYFVWHILGTISPVMSTMSAKSESRYVKFKMKNANKKSKKEKKKKWRIDFNFNGIDIDNSFISIRFQSIIFRDADNKIFDTTASTIKRNIYELTGTNFIILFCSLSCWFPIFFISCAAQYRGIILS